MGRPGRDLLDFDRLGSHGFEIHRVELGEFYIRGLCINGFDLTGLGINGYIGRRGFVYLGVAELTLDFQRGFRWSRRHALWNLLGR